MRSIPYDVIWKRLREKGASVSEDVIARHTPAEATTLYECQGCGLQFFAPSVPGDEEFYRQLMSSFQYYVPARYEFGEVESRIDGAVSVVDLGCGRGAFLRALKASRPTLRAVGVDSNQAALAELRSDGIEVYSDTSDVANREPHAFDVVCVFQLMEHVTSPTSLFASALQLLAPSGRLFISVPNRDRALGDPLDALDSPPHHITRWSPAQFTHLADQFGMSLDSVSFQAPSLNLARARHWQRAERRFESYGPEVARFMARVNMRARVPRRWHEYKLAHRLYARQGIVDHTMLAEFRR